MRNSKGFRSSEIWRRIPCWSVPDVSRQPFRNVGDRLSSYTSHVPVERKPQLRHCENLARQSKYVQRKIEARPCNHCCCGKVVIVTCSERMSVALVIQHAMWMCRSILPSVAYPALQFVPHYLINGRIFEKKKKVHLKCVFWFSLQLLSETFHILRDIIINIHRSSFVRL